MSLSKCSSWICRNKGQQKVASGEVYVDVKDFEGYVEINLCGQCLSDMLEALQ